MRDTSATPKAAYEGNDRMLFGIVLAVMTFWLFSQTTLNLIPDMQRSLSINAAVLNLAVSITSLVTGIFVAVFGGLADRLGSRSVHADRTGALGPSAVLASC